MATVSYDAELPADAQRVYDVLLDPERYGEWQPLHDSWPDGTPDLAVGASFVQRARFMGKDSDVTWTVVELEAPSTIVLTGEGAGGLALHSSYRLRDAGTGTALNLHTEVDGAPRMMRRLIERRAEALAAESVANLSALLQQDAATVPGERGATPAESSEHRAAPPQHAGAPAAGAAGPRSAATDGDEPSGRRVPFEALGGLVLVPLRLPRAVGGAVLRALRRVLPR